MYLCYLYVLYLRTYVRTFTYVCVPAYYALVHMYICDYITVYMYVLFFYFDTFQNDLTFLRVRTKKHEIMIAPGT